MIARLDKEWEQEKEQALQLSSAAIKIRGKFMAVVRRGSDGVTGVKKNKLPILL